MSLDIVEKEFTYLINKATADKKPARVRDLQRGLEEYRILRKGENKK